MPLVPGEVGIIEEYNQSLDAALTAYMNGDPKPFDEHIERWDMKDKVPENELARKGAVMKMVTARTGLPRSMRRKAKRWLDKRGFQSWDDGDL